jgi:hypothetical protein
MDKMESIFWHDHDCETSGQEKETMVVKTRKRFCGVLLLKQLQWWQ